MKNTKHTKQTAIKLITSSTLALSLIGVSNNFNQMQAAPTEAVSAAKIKKVKLTHNAYVYNSKGKRKKGKCYKEGTKLTTSGTKTIKGKAYLKISKGKYIKKANTKKNKVIDFDDARTVYSKPNGKAQQLWVSGKYTVSKTQKDPKGFTWYQIGKDKWIKSVPDPVEESTTEQNTSDSSSDNTKGPTKELLDNGYIEKVEKKFVNDVNEWRSKKGLNPLTINPEMHDYAVQRANEAGRYNEKYHKYDNHIRPDGSNPIYAEVEAGNILAWDPEKMADETFNEFVYLDAGSDWQHRDILGDPEYTKIGLSVGYGGLYDPKDPTGVEVIIIANLYK